MSIFREYIIRGKTVSRVVKTSGAREFLPRNPKCVLCASLKHLASIHIEHYGRGIHLYATQ